MPDLLNHLGENKAFLMAATGWTIRELHLWWPRLKPALLSVRAQGGLGPFLFSFLYNQKPKIEQPNHP